MKKVLCLFIVCWNLICSNRAFCQSVNVFDSIISIRNENTFIIGETHPCGVWECFDGDSASENLIHNYFSYKWNVTKMLIRERKLQQVILEYPVHMEYDFLRYQQTKDTNWLYSIGSPDFTKNMIIEYFDLLGQNNVKIRCFDLPTKKELPFLKLSLLNILLKNNNLKTYTNKEGYVKVDSLHCQPKNNSICNCYNINLRSINIDRLQFFQNEVWWLIDRLHAKGKRKNRKVHEALNNLLQKNQNKYEQVLGDEYILYVRILESFGYYLKFGHPRSGISETREIFMVSQFKDISQPYQLVITGNEHIHFTFSYLYKKHRNYVNFYELLVKDAVPIIPSVTYFTGEHIYRSPYEDEWIKNMELIESIKTSMYQVDIYQDTLGRLRIVTQIYYSKNLNDQQDP